MTMSLLDMFEEHDKCWSGAFSTLSCGQQLDFSSMKFYNASTVAVFLEVFGFKEQSGLSLVLVEI